MIRMIRFAAAALLCAAIGGKAATVSGTVRATAAAGATGTPIEGAKVVLIKVAVGGGAGGGVQTRLDSVNTDAQGAFSFAEVDTGVALLSAVKEGYQNGSGYANVASDTGHYSVNITLRPPADTTPGKLKGTVRAGSAQGTPIANATVVVSRTGGGGGAAPDTVKTDAQGGFAIESLPPAGYSVRASAAGYQNGTANATVRAKDSTEVTVVLLPENASGTLAGKVTKASDGSAVSGAKVIVSRSGGGAGAGAFQPDTVTTGSDGAYKIDSVPAQQGYTLTVKAEGYQTAVATGITVTYDQTRETDFLLVPAVAGDTAHGSVAGVVTDSAHKALAGVRIILSSGFGGGGGGAQTADTVETDAQGRFVIPNLPIGSYRLSASLSGYQAASQNALTVAVGQTAVANLSLRKSTAIMAVARSSGGMRLQAGAAGRMVLEAPAMGLPGRVRAYDARGALRFSGALPAGATRMEIPWARGRTGFVVVERAGGIYRLSAAAAL